MTTPAISARASAAATIAMVGLACAAAPRLTRLDADAAVVASAEGPIGLRERAATFYGRLVQRRFNTLSTYEDAVLRDFFRTGKAFSDYYAELAQSLDGAYFDEYRPSSATVEQFLVDAEDRVRVRIRFVGENRLPLRWWTVELVREDRWERSDGRWWIVPGRPSGEEI